MWQKSFHLRWNNHLQNLRTLFENLYNEQDFVDVTISCSDGLLHAHKLVLSACSPYFEVIFKENPCKHPTLILKGIRKQEMQKLLEYMYVGSVDVHEDDLEVLLSIANELLIKGLVSSRTDSETKIIKTKCNKDFNSISVVKEQPAALPEPVTLWQAELTAKSSDTNNSNNSKIPFGGVQVEAVNFMEHNKQVTKSFEHLSGTTEDMPAMVKEEILDDQYEGTLEESEDLSDTFASRPLEFCDIAVDEEESGDVVEGHIPGKGEGSIVCHICNRPFLNKPSFRRHLQTHTGEKPHQCSYCEQSFLRLSHLQRHIRVHTGERPYACSQCPKHFSRSDKLKQHLVIHHSGLAERICKPRGRPRKEVSEQSSSSPFSIARDFTKYLSNVSVSAAYNNMNT